MRDRRKAVGDVRLHHPTPASEGLIEQDLQSIVGRLLRAKPEAVGPEVGLEDRLDDDLQGRLHDAVPDRRDDGFILPPCSCAVQLWIVKRA